MYYRIAIQVGDQGSWKWKSTPLTSLAALFQLLRLYSPIPQDLLRVFMASSRQELDVMLAQENNGMPNNSHTAEQFLSQRGIRSQSSKQENSNGRTQEPQSRRVTTITLPPLVTSSIPTVASFSDQQGMSALEKRRIELEMGNGGDHDEPYTFALPVSVPQLLAWTKLLARIQKGELLP
jgi:hypothetical protein